MASGGFYPKRPNTETPEYRNIDIGLRSKKQGQTIGTISDSNGQKPPGQQKNAIDRHLKNT
jgi:hypothetical protein